MSRHSAQLCLQECLRNNDLTLILNQTTQCKLQASSTFKESLTVFSNMLTDQTSKPVQEPFGEFETKGKDAGDAGMSVCSKPRGGRHMKCSRVVCVARPTTSTAFHSYGDGTIYSHTKEQ